MRDGGMTGETITTVEGLDALPVGSVVRSQATLTYERWSYPKLYPWRTPGGPQDYPSRHIDLPVVVLYRPDADTGPPEGDETIATVDHLRRHRAAVAEEIAQAIEGVGMISRRDLEPYWEGWDDAIARAARVAREYGQAGAT